MKKLFISALMAVAATSAFAGDSDALKSILKAKTYAEAEALVKSSLGNLADDAEKARAYNKLVDLAMEKYTAESTIITENQLAEQMKTGKTKEYDAIGMADAILNAIAAAAECDKYDQLPNAKGKVAPKFAEKNKVRVWAARPQLVNVGQTEAQKGDDAAVLKYWGGFLDSENIPLFATCDRTSENEYIGQVALFSARYAYQAKEIDRCLKYCDMAMKSEQEAKDALDLKLYVMKSDLKTAADSLQYIDRLKDEYAKNPANDNILDNLYTMYVAMKQKDAAIKLLDERLAQDPNNFVALADKGMLAIQDNDADTAVKYLKQAAAVNPQNAVVLTYLGACLNVQASNAATSAAGKPIYKEAIEVLDKAKEIDPNKAQANWGYNRYQAYYGYYGPDAAETKAAEEDSH